MTRKRWKGRRREREREREEKRQRVEEGRAAGESRCSLTWRQPRPRHIIPVWQATLLVLYQPGMYVHIYARACVCICIVRLCVRNTRFCVHAEVTARHAQAYAVACAHIARSSVVREFEDSGKTNCRSVGNGWQDLAYCMQTDLHRFHSMDIIILS